MLPYAIEELSWATVQEREQEARKARRAGRPRREREPKAGLRSAIARTLVHTGLHLDPNAGDLASSHKTDEGY